MSKNVEPLWKAVSKNDENEKFLRICVKKLIDDLIYRRDVQYV